MFLKLKNLEALNCSLGSTLSEHELELCFESSLYQEFQPGSKLENDEIYLIVEGNISVRNEDEEGVKSYSDGLLGLDSLFQDLTHWHDYTLYAEDSAAVLNLDKDIFLKQIKNHSSLATRLHHQANQLDLLLLHFAVTRSCLVNRVNLSPYLGSLKQIIFEPGLIRGCHFLLNQFLILYNGNLIHDSGKELIKGQVYNCAYLPSDGEWLSLEQTHLFVFEHDEEEREEGEQNSQHGGQGTVDPIIFNDCPDLSEDELEATLPNRPGKIWTKLSRIFKNFNFGKFRLKNLSGDRLDTRQ